MPLLPGGGVDPEAIIYETSKKLGAPKKGLDMMLEIENACMIPKLCLN